MKRPFLDMLWTAPRSGQDWRDNSVLEAIDWLTSSLDSGDWARRVTAANDLFQAAKSEWAMGRRVPLFDPTDEVAWYVHQARCYAEPALRPDFFEPQGYRIAPLFRRLGQLLPELGGIVGAHDRAARLMKDGRSQPDDGFYELLVAATYKRRGWDMVEFVPEMPGVVKRPDIFVERGNARWAVECKRAGRSGYARDERLAGERMATLAHEVSREATRPMRLLVRFTEELETLPVDYLASRVAQFIARGSPYEWEDEGGSGGVDDVDWEPLLLILETDDLFFGSSRMIELLLGRYHPAVDYSVAGEWIPAEGRPLHATSVSHVSIVAWTSASEEAARRKAQHFRGVVGRASEQLPGDRPGIIHVGYEALGGNSADGLRHRLNEEQMQTFDIRDTRLAGVYGNYLLPEHVTARYESLAITETIARYAVRGSRWVDVLSNPMLFLDEDVDLNGDGGR